MGFMQNGSISGLFFLPREWILRVNFAQALSKMENTIVLLFSCKRNLIISYIRHYTDLG